MIKELKVLERVESELSVESMGHSRTSVWDEDEEVEGEVFEMESDEGMDIEE